MNAQCIIIVGIALLPITSFSDQSFYCPERQGYISPGMSALQVINACGPPLQKQDANLQVVDKIPVTQLIYTTLNQGAVYTGYNAIYNMWSLPSGSNGLSLQVNIIDNKVSGVNINGAISNSVSLCGGVNIQIGDDVNKVYSACGNPSLINETFINQPIPKNQHPEVWVYQPNAYQAPIHLTFVNGELQSID